MFAEPPVRSFSKSTTVERPKRADAGLLVKLASFCEKPVIGTRKTEAQLE
jgi:hypothetical protein